LTALNHNIVGVIVIIAVLGASLKSFRMASKFSQSAFRRRYQLFHAVLLLVIYPVFDGDQTVYNIYPADHALEAEFSGYGSLNIV
jgi:hypothetical protein